VLLQALVRGWLLPPLLSSQADIPVPAFLSPGSATLPAWVGRRVSCLPLPVTACLFPAQRSIYKTVLCVASRFRRFYSPCVMVRNAAVCAWANAALCLFVLRRDRQYSTMFEKYVTADAAQALGRHRYLS